MDITTRIQRKLYSESYFLLGTGKHHVFKTTWSVIRDITYKWIGNRDPDPARVQTIYEYHLSGGYIPMYICVAELGDGLVCYDGNHRRMVMDIINRDDFPCIVDVIFNAVPKDIMNAFANINMSVPVPLIYVKDDDIKPQIIELVDWYVKTYPAFVSSSHSCRRPNFNRDRFTDNLFNIYKYFAKTKTIAQIGEALLKLNSEYAACRICKAHGLYPHTAVHKCRLYGFWLFIEGDVNSVNVGKVIN